jgi:hypothetical protein
MNCMDRKPYDLVGQSIHQCVQRAPCCFPQGLLFSDRLVWERATLEMGCRRVLRSVRPYKIEEQPLLSSIPLGVVWNVDDEWKK